MAKYLSQEWCDLYKEEINKSAAYEEAAKTWEGDFYFITEPGGPIKEMGYMYVDLYHGKCRACEIVTDPSKYKPAFTITASYPIWKKIATKKLDPTQALITKQSKMTGDMAKVMRYTKAANELTNCTTRVPTEWLD
jgi:putative sterol carrier protein